MRYCLLLFSLLFLFPFLSYAENAGTNDDKILIISSYSPLKENGNHVISSFRRHLEKKKKIQINTEYLDSESFPDYEYWKEWLTSLFNAYEKRPEMVVLFGGEIWSVYRECCPETWRNIPIVLGGVKRGYINYRKELSESIGHMENLVPMVNTFGEFKVTGYYLVDYFYETIRLVQSLKPETTDIAFCYDNRYHYAFIKEYLSETTRKAGNLKIHYWFGDRLSTSDLVDSIVGMDEHCAVISAGWFTDVNHYPHAYSMLHNRLLNYPEKNLFQILDQDISNPNYFGGYFVTGREIGTDLANLAYTVLTRGIENSPPFGETPSPPKYHLNYETFKEAGFDQKCLSDGVVWYNVTPTFWEKYRWGVLTGVIFFIGFFFFFSWFRYRKERIYEKSNREMKQMLQVMPDMAVVYDSELRVADIINPTNDLLLNYEKKLFIGHKIEEIAQMIPELEDVASQVNRNLKNTFVSGKTNSFNVEMTNGDKTVHVEARTVPFGKDRVICFVHDITSRVIAENEVIKYKNFLNSIIDNLPVGVYVKDASNEYRYIYYNQKALDFDKKKINLILGKNDFEVGDPLAEQYRKEDEAVLESDGPVTYERYKNDQESGPRYAITTKTKLVNNDGTSYIIAILVDVTNVRKNQVELENIRRELSVALDAGSLAAWVYDIDKNYFTSLYNEALVYQGLGYSDVEEIIYPDDREKYRLFIDDLATGRCEKKKEILRAFKNGGYAWYEIQAIGIRSLDSRRICQVVGTEKNITEELQKQKELEASNFRTELAISSNGIVQWDYDVAQQVFSSPNVNSYMHDGITKDDFAVSVYPEDLGIFSEALYKLVNQDVESLNIQIRVWLPQKGLRWVDIHAVIFEKDQQGKVVQITGLRRDITDWKNVTDELIMLRDKAEESNRLKTAFLANMSHEIRTPLNAIVGFSNLISQTDDPEEIKEYSAIIETNNELLLQLINDILDLSKIEAGQLEFIYSDIYLRSIFTSLEQIYCLRLKEGVKLICDLPDEDYIIHSEKNRLTQVISNFLSNACKYTSSGCIKMGFRPVEGGLRFFVTDTGKGIAAENLPHAFDRFRKFDSFVQGTGLGLSICQTIVSRLGGEIGVKSELGRGSTFWFTIPCKPEGGGNNKLQAEKPSPVIQKAKKEREKGLILVAEDNNSNYLLLYNILKKDFRVERARDGSEAIRLYGEIHPDLIFMDMKMPVMNGIEATKYIRGVDSGIPIIALTANAFDEDREKAAGAGCSAYMSKPVNLKELRELLSQYFDVC